MWRETLNLETNLWCRHNCHTICSQETTLPCQRCTAVSSADCRRFQFFPKAEEFYRVHVRCPSYGPHTYKTQSHQFFQSGPWTWSSYYGIKCSGIKFPENVNWFLYQRFWFLFNLYTSLQCWSLSSVYWKLLFTYYFTRADFDAKYSNISFKRIRVKLSLSVLGCVISGTCLPPQPPDCTTTTPPPPPPPPPPCIAIFHLIELELSWVFQW